MKRGYSDLPELTGDHYKQDIINIIISCYKLMRAVQKRGSTLIWNNMIGQFDSLVSTGSFKLVMKVAE